MFVTYSVVSRIYTLSLDRYSSLFFSLNRGRYAFMNFSPWFHNKYNRKEKNKQIMQCSLLILIYSLHMYQLFTSVSLQIY